MQPAHLFCRTVIRLCRGMNRHRTLFPKHREYCHILYEDSIYTSFLQLTDDTSDSLYLVIVNDGIQRDIDLSTKKMSITAQLSYILDTIPCCGTCTETRRTDIYGVS